MSQGEQIIRALLNEPHFAPEAAVVDADRVAMIEVLIKSAKKRLASIEPFLYDAMAPGCGHPDVGDRLESAYRQEIEALEDALAFYTDHEAWMLLLPPSVKMPESNLDLFQAFPWMVTPVHAMPVVPRTQ